MKHTNAQKTVEFVNTNFNYLMQLGALLKEAIKDPNCDEQDTVNLGVMSELTLESLIFLMKTCSGKSASFPLRRDEWTKIIMELDDIFSRAENDSSIPRRLSSQATQVCEKLWELKHHYAGIEFDDRFDNTPDWLSLSAYRKRGNEIQAG